jgi:hypothetical protein
MWYQCIYNANRLREDIMQRRCLYLSYKFTKKMEQNSHEQLANGKHIKNDCFPRTLKFEM